MKIKWIGLFSMLLLLGLVAGKKEKRSLTKESCSQPAQPGPCRAAIEMYYWDVESSSCLKFLYGGCRGNANQFGSAEECIKSCEKFFEPANDN